ncbi:MAG: sugar ABC transporter permease [Thermorudis peleae]|nr:sugar ABC transporter permease [Thermorudis peleae]
MQPVRTWRDAVFVIAFLFPALALLGLFIVWPAIWAFAQSLTNRSLTGPAALHPQFVGLENYRRLLQDSEFHASLGKSVLFVLLSAIIGQTVAGFFIAYLMARRPGWQLRFTPVFAAIFVLPLAAPETVAALAWASLTTGTPEGLLNRALSLVGAGPVQWLQQYAFPVIIVVNIWRGITFAMVFFAAAIESLPTSALEAAMIDGATAGQRLFRIVIPMLRPQILIFLMLTTITTFGIFGLVYFLTRGGPQNATEIIGIYVYKRAFQYFDIGLGSAASVVLLCLLLILGLYYVRLMKEQV